MIRWILCMITGLLVLSSGHSYGDPAGDEKTSKTGAAVPVPKAMQQGELLFNAHCSACHGVKASGTDHGPTFLSKIYEPSHHGDDAFVRAALLGVRAHHWNFGNMPPVPNIAEKEVREIIGYVRWLQKQSGIE